MSHKHLFVTLPAVSLVVSGFSGKFAQEAGGGPGWIGVLIVLILLIPLVWWLMRSSGAKMTEPGRHPAEAHAPHAETSLAASEAQIAPPPPESAPARSSEPASASFAAAVQEAAPPSRAQVLGKPDDLTVIEGIGPKISRVLQENGIKSFAELATASLDQVEEILQKAGLSNITEPATWPEQAQLAAEGKWDELKTLQGQLKGGRRS